MMDESQDARIQAGDDKTLSILLANPSGADLTGMTAKYIMGKSVFGPAPAIIQKDSPAGVQIVSSGVPPGYDRILKVILTHDDTKDVPPGWYYHECTCILTSGAIITAMVGQMRIDPTWIASALP